MRGPPRSSDVQSLLQVGPFPRNDWDCRGSGSSAARALALYLGAVRAFGELKISPR